MMWPQKRAQELQEKTLSLLSKRRIRVHFHPNPEVVSLNYFPRDLAKTLVPYGDHRFELVDLNDVQPSDVDIVIFTAHGTDLSVALWDVRKIFKKSIVALWLWDNHLGDINNFKSALAVDYIFPSHAYASRYLSNPVSVGVHVPLCSAQWSKAEAAEMFESFHKLPRSDKLLINYVDYPFSWRSGLLRRLAVEMSEADVLLMHPDDRGRYFNKCAEDKFKEWISYKVSLILPMDRDLSTRVFDGLLCGQTLVVPETILDFDEVIPPSIQDDLGIIRLQKCDVSEIRESYQKAVTHFNRDGAEGMKKRHRFVLERHLLGNRVQMIVNQILDVASGRIRVTFETREKTYSLHLTTPPFTE